MSKRVKKEDQLDLSLVNSTVAEYLKTQYRPFAINDLILNLHNQINKATMIKALNELVESGEVIVKPFGKINIYIYKEIKLDNNDKNKENSPPKIEITDELIEETRKSVSELSKEIKELGSQLSQLTNQRNNMELLNDKENLLQQISYVQLDIIQLKEINMRTKEAVVESRILDLMKVEISKLEKIYNHRLKIQKNIMDSIKENLDNPKKSNDLFDELGLDLMN